MPDDLLDGRLRKGAWRRRELVDATLRLIGRGGIPAVSQRAVAVEAGVSASAILYHFTTVDDLLVATLVEVNDRYVAAVGAVTDVPALEALLAACAAQDRALAIAEYELWMLCARRADLRPELERWDRAMESLAARLSDDPVTRRLLVAVVNGLHLTAALGTDTDTTVLRHLIP